MLSVNKFVFNFLFLNSLISGNCLIISGLVRNKINTFIKIVILIGENYLEFNYVIKK